LNQEYLWTAPARQQQKEIKSDEQTLIWRELTPNERQRRVALLHNLSPEQEKLRKNRLSEAMRAFYDGDGSADLKKERRIAASEAQPIADHSYRQTAWWHGSTGDLDADGNFVLDPALARQRREKGVTLEVVATLPGGAAKDRSMKATEDLLQAHPGLNGIFAINDPSALGAVAALEKAGKLAQVKVVGFDGMPEGKAAIMAGKLYADPIQFPDRIGQTAVRHIVKYLAGDDVPPETLIPTQLYRRADAAKDPAVK
jgi:hypothetical protein